MVCLRAKLATGMKLVLARTRGSNKGDFLDAIRPISWKPFIRRARSFDVAVVGDCGNVKVVNDLRTTLIQEIKYSASREGSLPPKVSESNPNCLFSILVRKRKQVILADLFNDIRSSDDLALRLTITAFRNFGLSEEEDVEVVFPILSDSSQLIAVSEAFRGYSPRAQRSAWYFQKWSFYNEKLWFDALNASDDLDEYSSKRKLRLSILDDRQAAKNAISNCHLQGNTSLAQGIGTATCSSRVAYFDISKIDGNHPELLNIAMRKCKESILGGICESAIICSTCAAQSAACISASYNNNLRMVYELRSKTR